MSRSQKKKHRARLRHEFTLSNRLKQRLEEEEERRQFYYVRERETPVNHVKAEQAAEADTPPAVLIENVPFNVGETTLKDWVLREAKIPPESLLSCDTLLSRKTRRPTGSFHLTFAGEDAIKLLKKRSSELSSSLETSGDVLGTLYGRKIRFRILRRPYSARRLGKPPSNKRYELKRIALAEMSGSESIIVRWAVPDLLPASCVWPDSKLGDDTKALHFTLLGGQLTWGLMFKGQTYELRLHTRDLRRQIDIDATREEDSVLTLSLHLAIPPSIWKLPKFPWLARGEERETDFTGCGVIGSCLVHRLTLFVDRNEHHELLSELSRYGLCANPHRLQEHTPLAKYVKEESIDEVQKIIMGDKTNDLVSALDFDVRYNLEVAISKGNLTRSVLTPQFYKQLQHMKRCSAVNALRKIAQEDFLESKPFNYLAKYEEDLTEEDEAALMGRLSQTGKGLMSIRRVTVTPTRHIVHEIEYDRSNRVTRHFSSHLSRFLRVSFRDENFDPIPSLGSSVLFERMKRYLKCGITIAGRKYAFLACSASQLKEGSAWFFADLSDKLTVDDIRGWMGDFSDIRNVSMYATRMGQCFSSTFEGMPISEEHWTEIRDVRRSGYNFSDGCGLISESIAKKMAKRIKVGEPTGMPSACQIRFNGCKGVVSVWPDEILEARSGQRDMQLLVRPSMRKFDVTHSKIGVIGTSKFRPAFLNRQIILLLSTRRVPDARFIDLQERMLESLKGISSSEANARDVLLRLSGDGKVSREDMLRMIEAGFDVGKEPFLHQQLLSLRKQHVKNLETKSKVYVPESVNLYGVMDETDTLNYGEVFIQICGPMTDNKCVIISDRDVVVAKNPMLHPGDVRVLRAKGTGVPESLKRIINCCVFPSRGHRDHPSECSGSDLDGDKYFVLWNRDLIPLERYADPMEYKAPAPKLKLTPVTISDLIDFFTEFAKNNDLSRIALAHLKNADLSSKKAYDVKCLILAQLHAIAVDYPKTGVPAKMMPELNAPTSPDFLGKKRKDSHKSDKVLGEMYRRVEQFSREAQIFESTKVLLDAFPDSLDDDLYLPGYENHYDEFKGLLRIYQENLRDIMNRFGIESEFDLLTVTVLRVGKHFKQLGLYDTKALINVEISELRQRFSRFFKYGCEESDQRSESHTDLEAHSDINMSDEYDSGDNEESGYSDDEEYGLLQRASACYLVAYESAVMYKQNRKASTDRNLVGLLSFPWVCASRELCKLKAHRISEKKKLRQERAVVRDVSAAPELVRNFRELEIYT